MDPVFCYMLSQLCKISGYDIDTVKAINEYRVHLHLMVALKECAAGGILLLWIVFCNKGNDRSYARMINALARISIIFLLGMHSIIVLRLVQIGWNYEVIGWNLSYFCLALLLWKQCWNRNFARNEKSKKGSKLIWIYSFLFVIMPAAVPFGYLDPYLGSSLYSENLPLLELEIPIGTNDIYNEWGLVDGNFYPATSSDHRRIARVYYINFNVKTKNTVGYSSIWAQKQFVSSLCDKLCDTNIMTNIDDSRFFLLPSFTGWSLFEYTWDTIVSALTKTPKKQKVQSLLVQDGCSNEWNPILNTEFTRPILVSFTSKLKESIEIFYVNRATTSATLISQMKIDSSKGQMGVKSFGGHIFVAARRIGGDDNDMENLCSLMVWTVVPTIENKIQRFVLEEHQIMESSDVITLPGLKPCGKEFCDSDEDSCFLKSDVGMAS